MHHIDQHERFQNNNSRKKYIDGSWVFIDIQYLQLHRNHKVKKIKNTSVKVLHTQQMINWSELMIESWPLLNLTLEQPAAVCFFRFLTVMCILESVLKPKCVLSRWVTWVISPVKQWLHAFQTTAWKMKTGWILKMIWVHKNRSETSCWCDYYEGFDQRFIQVSGPMTRISIFLNFNCLFEQISHFIKELKVERWPETRRETGMMRFAAGHESVYWN